MHLKYKILIAITLLTLTWATMSSAGGHKRQRSLDSQHPPFRKSPYIPSFHHQAIPGSVQHSPNTPSTLPDPLFYAPQDTPMSATVGIDMNAYLKIIYNLFSFFDKMNQRSVMVLSMDRDVCLRTLSHTRLIHQTLQNMQRLTIPHSTKIILGRNDNGVTQEVQRGLARFIHCGVRCDPQGEWNNVVKIIRLNPIYGESFHALMLGGSAALMEINVEKWQVLKNISDVIISQN